MTQELVAGFGQQCARDTAFTDGDCLLLEGLFILRPLQLLMSTRRHYWRVHLKTSD